MQKNVLRIFKFISWLLVLCALIPFCAIFYFKHQLKTENQTVLDFVHRIEPPSAAVAFHYSKHLDQQLNTLFENLGFGEKTIPFSGTIPAANGFVSLELNPEKAGNVFPSIDDLVSVFLDENASLDNSQGKLFSQDHPLSPVADLMETIWNDQVVSIGSVVQFQPDFFDCIRFIGKLLKDRFWGHFNGSFRHAMTKNVPQYVKYVLEKHKIQVNDIQSVYDQKNGIYETTLHLVISDPKEFLDSICTEKVNLSDVCGRFLFDRKKVRKNLYSTLFILNDRFEVKLNLYWKLHGSSFVFSNSKNFISQLFSSGKSSSAANVLTMVSASGDDFLFPDDDVSQFARVSVLLDMIRIQNKTIDLFERIKKQSRMVENLLETPSGGDSFERIQFKVNQLTSYSDKTALTLKTDGNTLFSEARLLSPSEDLFTPDGKNVSVETLNAMRLTLAQMLSFGHYQILRGLFPIPKPVVLRNGPWAIIRSQLPVRSIAPYLKRVGPQIGSDEGQIYEQ